MSIKYDCSVVVCNYNPDWEKLRLTLKSIIMQEKCSIQIIVTDDGSENNLFANIKFFFQKNNFAEYKLISSENNMGTVHNILQGLYYCDADLVKPISPGDMLHGRECLQQWVYFMRKQSNYVMSYCDAIYYSWCDRQIVPLKMRTNPQSRNPTAKEYIVYRDLCLGASAMVRRQKWVKYLEKIQGKVIYAEDYSYQLMIYSGEKLINIPKTLLLYEYGTGISTCRDDVWNEKLLNDTNEMNRILLSNTPGLDNKATDIKKYLRIQYLKGWKYRILRVVFYPSKILFRLKWLLFPRTTSRDLDQKFVADLLE